MKKERAEYGSGSTYKSNIGYVSQLMYTIEIDEKEYNKRISGSGDTGAKAVRNRNKNAKKWEEQLRKKLAEESAKGLENKEYLTLNDVICRNLGFKDNAVQVSTSDNYATYFEGYIKDHEIGKVNIQEISEEQLLAFYNWTKNNGRKRTKKDEQGTPVDVKPLSIATMNHIRFVLDNTFTYAMKKKIIKENPHVAIAKFRSGTASMIDYDSEDLDIDSDENDALQRIIPLEDIETFLAYAFEHSRLAGLFAWAVNSGMRQGECLGLKRKLAIPENDYIFVKKSLTFIRDRREGATRCKIPKLKAPKNGKERKVPYNQNLKLIYKFQMEQITKEKKIAGKLYEDRGVLFADEYGDYLRPWKVITEFQKLLEALGMEKHRFHDLRHTFVSLLVKVSQQSGDGISILEVSKIVGHSDPTVTLKIYGGLFPDATERAMRTLDICDSIKIPTHNGKSCA